MESGPVLPVDRHGNVHGHAVGPAGDSWQQYHGQPAPVVMSWRQLPLAGPRGQPITLATFDEAAAVDVTTHESHEWDPGRRRCRRCGLTEVETVIHLRESPVPCTGTAAVTRVARRLFRVYDELASILGIARTIGPNSSRHRWRHAYPWELDPGDLAWVVRYLVLNVYKVEPTDRVLGLLAAAETNPQAYPILADVLEQQGLDEPALIEALTFDDAVN